LLCAFAINKDGVGKLSSAPPFSKLLDPPLGDIYPVTVRCSLVTNKHSTWSVFIRLLNSQSRGPEFRSHPCTVDPISHMPSH